MITPSVVNAIDRRLTRVAKPTKARLLFAGFRLVQGRQKANLTPLRPSYTMAPSVLLMQDGVCFRSLTFQYVNARHGDGGQRTLIIFKNDDKGKKMCEFFCSAYSY